MCKICSGIIYKLRGVIQRLSELILSCREILGPAMARVWDLVTFIYMMHYLINIAD